MDKAVNLQHRKCTHETRVCAFWVALLRSYQQAPRGHNHHQPSGFWQICKHLRYMIARANKRKDFGRTFTYVVLWTCWTINKYSVDLAETVMFYVYILGDIWIQCCWNILVDTHFLYVFVLCKHVFVLNLKLNLQPAAILNRCHHRGGGRWRWKLYQIKTLSYPIHVSIWNIFSLYVS